MRDKKLKIEYKPLVSVALATYNGVSFLRKQLDSLLAQSYSRFEVIISDDGSTDGTQEILNEYHAKDKRITWTLNTAPHGFIKNFERAIGLCKGEIIFLCDQDDTWFPEKIATHIQVYQEPDIFWAYNRVVLIDSKDKEIGYLENTAPDYYKKRRLLDNTWGSCILGCATSYRASALHQVMPIGKCAPAHDSWIQLALFPRKSVCLSGILQAYRIHDNNTAGWGHSPTEEREQQAIRDNFCYLKNLPQSKNLALWKRSFFFCVFSLKKIRAVFY